MKKLFLIFSLAVLTALTISESNAQLKIGNRKIDVKKATEAASDIATAIKLSDADVMKLCKESVEYMDSQNQIADDTTPWGARLKRLTERITEVNGIPLNFKVYQMDEINAFASGDGSVRVFSSLMDVMNDEELVAIIGHEIGHIANADVKDAIKNSYLISAGRNAAGSAGGLIGKLSDSELGELTSAFLGAKFSRTQENEADDFGFKFAIERGYSPYAMSNSLKKLVELSGGSKSSALANMFSSHPDSDKRASRTKQLAEEYIKKNPKSAEITTGRDKPIEFERHNLVKVAK